MRTETREQLVKLPEKAKEVWNKMVGLVSRWHPNLGSRLASAGEPMMYVPEVTLEPQPLLFKSDASQMGEPEVSNRPLAKRVRSDKPKTGRPTPKKPKSGVNSTKKGSEALSLPVEESNMGVPPDDVVHVEEIGIFERSLKKSVERELLGRDPRAAIDSLLNRTRPHTGSIPKDYIPHGGDITLELGSGSHARLTDYIAERDARAAGLVKEEDPDSFDQKYINVLLPVTSLIVNGVSEKIERDIIKLFGSNCPSVLESVKATCGDDETEVRKELKRRLLKQLKNAGELSAAPNPRVGRLLGILDDANTKKADKGVHWIEGEINRLYPYN